MKIQNFSNFNWRVRRLLGNEKVRFLIIGGINTVLGLLVFYVVQFLIGKYVTYIGSLLVTHFMVSTLGFVLYRKYVFKVTGNLFVDYVRFQSVYSISLISNLIILPILVTGLHWNVYFAQTLTVIGVTFVSFIGHKFFSFRRSS